MTLMTAATFLPSSEIAKQAAANPPQHKITESRKFGVRGEEIEDGLVDGGPEFVSSSPLLLPGDPNYSPTEVPLEGWVAMGVEELVVVDVVVVFHAQGLPR